MNPGRKEIRNCILFLSGSALLFILFFSFLAAFFTVSEAPEKEKMLHSAPVLVWEKTLSVPERRSPFLYHVLIETISGQYQLDPALVAAVIEKESGFDPFATAFDGGQGLMQLMPEVSRERKCLNPYDPAANIRGGAAHLRRMMKIFSGVPETERNAFALAAYNCGPGHVFDARKLAKKLKLNPDCWKGNVAEAIQFLNHPEYYRKAEYGRCDGVAVVSYVECILALRERYLPEFRE